MQLQLRVAASDVLAPVVDAQHDPVPQSSAAGHRALRREGKRSPVTRALAGRLPKVSASDAKVLCAGRLQPGFVRREKNV